MMIRFDTREAQRAARMKYITDDVFPIAYNVLQERCVRMSALEIFANATSFTQSLLAMGKNAGLFIQDEVEELKDSVGNDTDAYLMLIVSLCQLSALRKREPAAPVIAGHLIGYCQQYDDCTTVLMEFANCEHKRWLDGARADLLNYELKSIEAEGGSLDAQREVISALVDNCLGLTSETMERMLAPLMSTNDQYGGAFTPIINQLKEKLGIKTDVRLHIDQHNHGCPQFYGKMENPTFTTPNGTR